VEVEGQATVQRLDPKPALEATQGQMDGFLSQLPYKCHLEEVASVGDYFKICPQLDSRGGLGLRVRVEGSWG